MISLKKTQDKILQKVVCVASQYTENRRLNALNVSEERLDYSSHKGIKV